MTHDPKRFRELFPPKPIIGMIHLQALPGSPDYGGSLDTVLEFALHDTNALEQGGVDAIMIENFFDAPFFKDQVGAETIASMASVITVIRQHTKLPLGVNVLRNDGISAIAVATACRCQFVRINQMSWASIADQGVIEGKAAQVLRYRRLLDSKVLIFTDCLTKHAVPFGPQSMEFVAMDTWERGGADALIISGVATGKPTALDDVLAARKGAPDAPLLIGSGMELNNLATLLPAIDGAIIGTSFKEGGKVEQPVSLSRVREFVQAKKTLHKV